MNTIKKPFQYVFTLGFAIILGHTGFAQTEETNENNSSSNKAKHYLGLHAGTTSGVGPSYMFRKGKMAAQATFLPISTDNYTWINSGLNIRYNIKEENWFNLFVYMSGNHIHQAQKNAWILTEYENGYYYLVNDRVKDNINLGFGPGIEFLAGKNFVFNLMTGYGAYNITNNAKYNLAIEGGVMIKL